MKLTIAVDVDLTVVDSLSPWLRDFELKVGVNFPRQRDTYHLGPAMSAMALERGIEYSPMEFWKNPKLYDNLLPLEDAKRAIDMFKYSGHDVIFVSSCFPEHEESKRSFCKRHFGDLPFIATSAKEYVDFDVIIDDNDEVMDACSARRPSALLIQPMDVTGRCFDKDSTMRYNPEIWFMIPEWVYEYSKTRYIKNIQSTIKEYRHA